MKKIILTFQKLAIFVISLLVILITVSACLYLIYNEELPQGNQPEAADRLAQKMLNALNAEAYNGANFIEWSFAGLHDYKWNKQKNTVQVSWDDFKVFLNTVHNNSSLVFENGKEVTEAQRTELIQKAVNFFNNDSFWLVAPYKVFDPGTKRSIVRLEGGSEGLLVSYTSGGSTPGDSYLWMLDEKGLPKAFKMWVNIIPIGGLKASWDSWQETKNGALLPSSHQFMFLTIDMGEVKAY